MKAKRALIIANGDIPRENIVRDILRTCDTIVCADGGARHARRLGIRPDVILGDLDSLPFSARRFFSRGSGTGRRRGVPVIRIPDQESTDLEKAIAHCIRGGFREAAVIGATGDRADHSTLALGCFRKFGGKIRLELVDRAGTLTLLKKRTVIPTDGGELFSLIPLGRCAGVTLGNVLYGLKGAVLETGVREGVSNRALGKRVRVSYRTGLLLLYRFHGDGGGIPGGRTGRAR